VQASPPSEGRVWLVPAHVPDHWTLVAICWELAEIRFYDSLPERTSATADEKVVRELIWVLLKVLVNHFGVILDLSGWTWVSELVSMHC
jgi:hypothetical protein